jgi:very-short-patch-repair endonuclease
MTTPNRRHLPELAFARRQRGLVTRSQLLSVMSAEAIRHRLNTGRLHRIYPGVYAVGRPDLTREGRWLAAVLACGEGAALSHVPAALYWGIVERGDERPHVTVARAGGRRGPQGLRVHASETLAPEDVVCRYGIPVTSLTRTLIDLAGVLDDRDLRSAVRRAEHVGLDLSALWAAVAEPASDPRKARLRRLLRLYVSGAVNAGLEDEFLDLCRRYRVRLPDEQQRVGRARVDFTWHDVRLIVETDDRGTHDTAVAFLDDRVRDRRLKAAGFEVLRFTWAEVRHRPAEVARELRAAIARRRRELSA